MKKITVSAPGKLMLLGEHAVIYNKPCLVTAVDQRMWLTAEVLTTPEFQLEAKDVKITGYKKTLKEIGKGNIPQGAKFIEIAIKNIAQKHPLRFGLRITTKSEFSPQLGLGSSSASAVCTIKALSELLKFKLTPKEIFSLSHRAVLDIQRQGSGFDVAAAVYGGTLYFLTGGKTIEQLSISELPLIVGYSGIKADTASLINKIKESFANRQDRLNEIYNSIEVLVNAAKDNLIEKNWGKFGELMNKNQEYLNELGVSTKKLNTIISAATSAGAYGSKLSGAGGGDCIIAIAPEEKRKNIESSITSVGGKIIPVKTNAEGVRLESL